MHCTPLRSLLPPSAAEEEGRAVLPWAFEQGGSFSSLLANHLCQGKEARLEKGKVPVPVFFLHGFDSPFLFRGCCLCSPGLWVGTAAGTLSRKPSLAPSSCCAAAAMPPASGTGSKVSLGENSWGIIPRLAACSHCLLQQSLFVLLGRG